MFWSCLHLSLPLLSAVEMSDNSFSHYKKERSSEETEYLYRFCLAKIHICGVDQHKKTLRHLKMITEDLLKSLSLISEAPKSLIYTGTSEILWSVQSWGQKKTISLSPYNVWTYYTGSLDFNAGFLICKKEFDQLISTLSNSLRPFEYCISAIQSPFTFYISPDPTTWVFIYLWSININEALTAPISLTADF